MKRLLCAIMLMLALVFALSACSEDAPQEPIITVSDDGYLVVNGVKTEYEVNKADVITIEDGYLVVNGVKTEHEVKNKNHSFGDWRLYNEDEADCEKKLYYRTCTDCSTIEWREGKYADHDFNTVTTTPTCQAGGYDTKTCEICGKVDVCNETPLSAHDYNTEYLADNSFHWQKCKNCDAIDGRGEHTLGDDGICTVCNEVVGATEGVVYDFSADGTYASVIAYAGTAKRIKIADEYKGVPVKEIYNEAFKNTSITSVIIPNSVTSIGNYAFSGCRFLASVVIPDSVASIGDYAFYGCTSLISVVIPDSVVSIGDYVFYECRSLASIVIPDSVTSIAGSAFRGCSKLTSVVIPDSVTSIGYRAFYDCYSLTSIVIPDSVTSIGSSAFSNCNSELYTEYEYGKYLKSGDNPYAVLIELTYKNLSTYEIHPNTKIIACSVFADCDRLSSIVIPDGVTSIGSSAFYDCDSLTSIVIPDGVTSIGSGAFYACDSLTSVVIGDSVTSIGYDAFSHCTSLTSIVIPDSVTSIGGSAFYDCPSLTDVYYTGTETEWAGIVIDVGNYNLTRATIHYNYIPEE